jgi:hypothetical protein
MPATPASPGGSFTVTAAPPAGFGDAVAANNSVVRALGGGRARYADLRVAKSKSPASGPIAPAAPSPPR